MITKHQADTLKPLRAEEGPKPKDYGKGRVCTYEGCGTVICRYRSGDRCWQHEPKQYVRPRGRPGRAA